VTDTVLFDFGGVIILTPFEMASRLERRRGMDPGELGLFGPFAPDRDPLWQELVSADGDEDEYWRRQAERLVPVLGLDGGDPARRLMETLFVDPDIVRPEVLRCVASLRRAGIRCAILSNHLARFHQPQLLPGLLERFDPVIDLSYASVRKPDPRAFEAAVARLGGPAPSSVLHVDDQPVHVAGAEDAGLRAVLFDPTDPAGSAEAVLAAAGVSSR